MKLQRTTIILILLALGLGGFVYFHEIRVGERLVQVKQKKQQQQIFSFAAEDVESLTIKTKNSAIYLERNSNGKTKWLLKYPTIEPCQDAVVSYLIDLLVKGKAERTLSISANQFMEFGLYQPLATIDVKLKNQKTHQIILGKTDFNHRFMYAQVDPATNRNANVLLVSTDFENAVNRELSEWKQKVEDALPSPSIGKPTPQVDDGNKTPSPLPSIDKPIPIRK